MPCGRGREKRSALRSAPGGINYPAENREKVGQKESQSNPSRAFFARALTKERVAAAPERKNHITGRQLTAPFRAVSAIN